MISHGPISLGLFLFGFSSPLSKHTFSKPFGHQNVAQITAQERQIYFGAFNKQKKRNLLPLTTQDIISRPSIRPIQPSIEMKMKPAQENPFRKAKSAAPKDKKNVNAVEEFQAEVQNNMKAFLAQLKPNAAKCFMEEVYLKNPEASKMFDQHMSSKDYRKLRSWMSTEFENWHNNRQVHCLSLRKACPILERYFHVYRDTKIINLKALEPHFNDPNVQQDTASNVYFSVIALTDEFFREAGKAREADDVSDSGSSVAPSKKSHHKRVLWQKSNSTSPSPLSSSDRLSLENSAAIPGPSLPSFRPSLARYVAESMMGSDPESTPKLQPEDKKDKNKASKCR